MRNQKGPLGVNPSEYLGSVDLETLTGTKASTWRYWASIGQGPASFKLGRRRVWKKSSVLAWLAEQEVATAAGDEA
jgi:predicted DNA-binding transcriptional regulator AlpA